MNEVAELVFPDVEVKGCVIASHSENIRQLAQRVGKSSVDSTRFVEDV